MTDNYNDPKISSSLKMYIFNDFEFILKRVINNKDEYYYCAIPKKNCDSNTVRGNLKDGVLVFDRIGFHYEITIEDIEKLECRILG